MEGLSNSSAPREAERIRAIALELERLANHVGDLGALANDVGFLPVSSYFGRLRAVFLNLLMALCGNRYGRNLLTPGGVRNGLTPELIPLFDAQLTDGRRDLEEIADLLFSTASAMARFEGTGIVRPETAQGLGLVGPAARASHLVRDVRRDFPFGLFREIPWKPVRCTSGDVHARARVRFLECRKSLEFLAEQTGILRHEPLRTPVGALAVNSLVISLTEGWRGEIVHAAATNAKGDLAFYKVVDPSFHNWMGLAMALRNGQISDFPLCNKSFNLSYAGHDL
jgi:Ni,Fe-hydrogenase III large subunit